MKVSSEEAPCVHSSLAHEARKKNKIGSGIVRISGPPRPIRGLFDHELSNAIH